MAGATHKQQAVAAKPPTVRHAVGAGRVRLIAWVLWLASLALVALGLLFLGLSASTPVPPGFGFRGVNVIFSVAFSTVGAVLTLRRPDTPIGWLFATVGLGFAVGAFSYDYGGLPLGPEAAWATQWGWRKRTWGPLSPCQGCDYSSLMRARSCGLSRFSLAAVSGSILVPPVSMSRPLAMTLS
jgi:hypothetical protein